MNIQPEKAQGEVSGRAKSWMDAELPVDEASERRRGACVIRGRRRHLASTPARPGGPFPYRIECFQARWISLGRLIRYRLIGYSSAQNLLLDSRPCF